MFHTLSHSFLRIFLMPAAMLAFGSGAYAAPPADGALAVAGAANDQHAPVVKCQRSIGEDDVGVCCRLTFGSRVSYKRMPRRNCSGPGKMIVNKGICPRRPVSESPRGGLICCQYSSTKTRIGPTWRVTRNTALMPATKCRTLQDGKFVSRSKCVKKKSRTERIRECRERGDGWAWENNRCTRSRVRDHRNR